MSGIPLGLRYMLAAALGFSVMGALAKQAAAGVPSQQIVLVRAVISLVLSYLTLRHIGRSPRGNRVDLLLLRGLIGTIALSCHYYALAELPLADATIIQQTSPIWTTLLAALLLGERPGWRVVVATVVSLVGVALMLRPASALTAGLRLDLAAVAIALFGAVASATVYVLVRHLRAHDDPHVVVFYFPLVAVPTSLPFALPVWVWPTATEWALLAGVGVATQVAQVAMTRGLALEAAGRATAMSNTQIVFGGVFGLLWFGEVPGLTTALGALAIVGATLAVATGETDRADRDGRSV